MEPNAPSPPPDEDFVKAIQAFQNASAQGNSEQVESAAMQALTLAAEWAEQNPSPELGLMNEAAECEGRGDWPGAESRLRQLAVMSEAAASRAHAHLKLCSLYLLLGRFDQAQESAAAAVESARKAGISVLQVMTLEAESVAAFRGGDLAFALRAATEAVALVEPEPYLDNLRAGALATRAICLAALGDHAGAERDLAASKPILLDCEVSPMLAGVHGKIAAWWEGAATLSTARGDHAAAAEEWGRAVAARRHVSSLCHVAGPRAVNALARVLAAQGQALIAAGRPTQAEAALGEAARIRTEIGIPDP